MSEVLELGVGKRPDTRATVRHDLWRHSNHVDVAHDLDCLPWPWPDAAFQTVLAIDVFEHLKVDVMDWLGECWRVLEPGGTLHMQVPQFGTYCHATDPTHRRGFTLDSFDYFVPGTHFWEVFGCFYDPMERWWVMEAKHRQGDNLIFTMTKKVQHGA